MTTFGGRCVFFVRDTPRALDYYTNGLGFSLDWVHEEQGRPFVVQVSLFGLQIILNQVEQNTESRPGHGRVFVGLDDAASATLLNHVEKQGIAMGYTYWGAPTAVITDLDQNELYIWLSDAERAKWQAAHGAPPNPSLERP
jgi:catechol 2,3-dioxygenase-like lactoylglutathione lyase family enzyme